MSRQQVEQDPLVVQFDFLHAVSLLLCLNTHTHTHTLLNTVSILYLSRVSKSAGKITSVRYFYIRNRIKSKMSLCQHQWSFHALVSLFLSLFQLELRLSNCLHIVTQMCYLLYKWLLKDDCMIQSLKSKPENTGLMKAGLKHLVLQINNDSSFFRKLFSVNRLNRHHHVILSSQHCVWTHGHIKVILYTDDFWISCDTEDWRNDAENSALITEINYISIFT